MNEIIYPPGCKDIQVDIPNDELIRRLKKIQQAFQDLEQTSEEKYKQLAIYLGSEIFLKHDNEDVQLLVACCIADIFRIYASESPPYEDPDNLKYIFIFLSNQLKGLRDYANTSFKRYFYLLENLECVKTFQLCLELDDSQEIITILFQNVFKIISDKHSSKVQSLLFDLLNPLLNESDQIAPKVIEILFTHIIEPNKSNNKESYNLAVNLIKKGGEHFEYFVQNHLNNLILIGKAEIPIVIEKMCLIIYELNQIRPSVLELALPQLEYKINSVDLKERREYTKLLSKMFSEKDSKLATIVPQLWEAYLTRFSDGNDDIRKICVATISDFLINHPELNENLYEQINNRSLDTEEPIRLELVEEILKTMKSDNSFINEPLLNVLKDRTLDIKIRIRKQTLQGLAAIYKKVHSKLTNKDLFQKINWIPSKIMRVHFQESSEDKLVVERLLNSSIVPYSLSSQERMTQLYYSYTTFDDFSVLSLMGIMKDRILLHQSIRAIINILEETPVNESKLNENVMIVAHNLLDVTKGQELMKNLIKLFKENINLKNHFKNLVNPSCSCSKSLELINLILQNLTSLNQPNMLLARRLIERMSSIVIDEESFECLIKLVETKIFNVDKNHELSYINDDGEKGLNLINQILRIHTNRLIKVSIYEKFISFLRSKKEVILVNVLKILSTHFSMMKDQLDEINEQTLPKFKAYIKNGTPKQAKHSIRCIYSNFQSFESILNDLYKEIIKEISYQNEKTFITLLVSIGHLSFYIPNLIGHDLKAFVSQNIIKQILVAQIKSENNDENTNNHHKRSTKLAGKWCEEDDLPFDTRAQIESIKMITRWCLGLKNECSSLVGTIRLFTRIIQEYSDLGNKVNKCEPEKAHIRLMCSTQLLKLAQEIYFRPHINAECFHILARTILDPVPSVRDVFIKKLNKSLKIFKLPIQFMAVFILSALDTNRDRKTRVKKLYISLIKTIRDQNKHVRIVNSETDKANELKIKNLPENCLPFAISLLAHNCKLDSLKDEATIKQLKDCVSFILDPLLDNPDGYQIAYIKKMLNTIKNSDDAFASAYIKTANATDQLKYGSNLMTINKKITTICEIAFFHIHSKIAVPVGKEYPLEIKLHSGFFLPKEILACESSIVYDNNETNQDLETTLSALKELDQSNEKVNKSGTSRKRKIQQRKHDDSAEVENVNDENDDENSSITSNSLSLNNTKTNLNVKSQAKKLTPNSSLSSLSSAKSSPAKKSKEQKVDTSPLSKKKKVDEIKQTILITSESSRENSPVIKLLKPKSKKEDDDASKIGSHSEIIITKIPAKDLNGESSKNDEKIDEEKLTKSARATRASNRQAKAENEPITKKNEVNNNVTKKSNRKKSVKEESDDESDKKMKVDDDDDDNDEEIEEEEEEEEEEEKEIQKSKIEKKPRGKQANKGKKKEEEKEESEEDEDTEEEKTTTTTKKDDNKSNQIKTPSSDTGVYTLRLRNRK